jgi:hypothetical protein
VPFCFSIQHFLFAYLSRALYTIRLRMTHYGHLLFSCFSLTILFLRELTTTLLLEEHLNFNHDLADSDRISAYENTLQ